MYVIAFVWINIYIALLLLANVVVEQHPPYFLAKNYGRQSTTIMAIGVQWRVHGDLGLDLEFREMIRDLTCQ